MFSIGFKAASAAQHPRQTRGSSIYAIDVQFVSACNEHRKFCSLVLCIRTDDVLDQSSVSFSSPIQIYCAKAGPSPGRFVMRLPDKTQTN